MLDQALTVILRPGCAIMLLDVPWQDRRMRSTFNALQAGLAAQDAGREGHRGTLEKLLSLTAGKPAYAKYHALYAQSIWESCQAARCAASLQCLSPALVCKRVTGASCTCSLLNVQAIMIDS